MDLMKSPFTDKKRKAVLSHASKVIYGNLKIPVKKCQTVIVISMWKIA